MPAIAVHDFQWSAQPGRGSNGSYSGNEWSFLFATLEAPSVAPSETTCESAREICSPSATIEPQGDAACEMTSGVVDGDTSCDADFDCTQAATVEGTPIVAKGRRLVRCVREATGEPWSCSCASDQQTARFPLGQPDADSSQACPPARLWRVSSTFHPHLGACGSFVPAPEPSVDKSKTFSEISITAQWPTFVSSTATALKRRLTRNSRGAASTWT